MPNVSPATHAPLFLLPNTFRAFYGAFRWLHSIQLRAIEPILQGRDVILQSATGSGKTEAVLAPCMERILTASSPASVLYIVPTRALAIDIFRRFQTTITERLGLAVAIRTGDIKKNGGGFPALMLSTPESLDVMLGSPNKDMRGFLARINTVVIDEAHPLIHHYRGHHLVYLLKRLERRRDRRLQKIALSATLGDPDEVRRFLGCDAETVCLAESVGRKIMPRLVHLLDDEGELVALIDDLHRHWDYPKILIFANSRGRCDKIFGQLNRRGAFRRMALLHYSNLSARRRKDVERRFRKQRRAVCVATSTLELGIDVGDVDAVVLFEPPDSVSAFLQRIGRANRRKARIHFWGICRGERAAEQVLRFLALLHLARQGRVETPLPKKLPSVLAQQIISCLYEKKRLSPAALKNLLNSNDHNGTNRLLDDIFAALVSRKWLRETDTKGIYSGGWRYRDALLAYRIWSNFPETEEDYSLIVSGEAVADIPLSIVRQFKVGDRVLLAGRRLHILWIDEGEKKCVLAEPAEDRRDAKEILWVGMGSHVSLETAQAMGSILKSRDPADNLAADGLFSRTRKLIEKQLTIDQKAVALANSIEVVLTGSGFYQFRTYLGAVGNMILAQSVKAHFEKVSKDVCLQYDEIGLTCSEWVRFEELALPLDAESFDKWIMRNANTVQTMFPLNAFCNTLPPEILRRELADFVLDPRLTARFRKYADSSSEIVKGDPRHLTFSPQPEEEKRPEVVETAARDLPLLIRFKERLGVNLPKVHGDAPRYRIRPLTGTILGDFFRHRQCRRWLCYQFLRPEDQPPQQGHGGDEFSRRRKARGLAFEARILDELQGVDQHFHRIADRDQHGNARSLDSRRAETCDWLNRAYDQPPGRGRFYLAQGVLVHETLLSPPPSRFDPFHPTPPSLKGVGIPDLVCAFYDGKNFRIDVGDIKSSLRPRYHQKWQVAFYAYLLDTYLRRRKEEWPAVRIDTGFLLFPSPIDDTPKRCSFDLGPYLATIKTVFRNFEHSLSNPPNKAFWQMQRHCVNCVYFDDCYRQALVEEDIQFIPRLSRGELLKLRALGIRDIAATANGFAGLDPEKKKETPSSAQPSMPLISDHEEVDAAPSGAVDRGSPSMIGTDLSPAQKKRLQTAAKALGQNRIIFEKDSTRLFPANAATFFFVHLLSDPVTLRPNAFGLGVKKRNQTLQIFTWRIAPGSTLLPVWQEFRRRLLDYWQKSVSENGVPHILLIGDGIREQLFDWAAVMQDQPLSDLFRQKEAADWTDLKQVLQSHFALPVPGNLSSFALAYVLGLPSGQHLKAPESAWHGDRSAGMEITEDNGAEVDAYLSAMITFDLQLFQWITSRLKSDRHREIWEPADPSQSKTGQLYLRLIEAEQTYRERDIKRLQALSLPERVARFRALGPLRFTGTTLDREGRFLYTFVIVDHNEAGLSKFRPGDFLKLVPSGLEDLQSGIPIILVRCDPPKGVVVLHSRRKKGAQLNKNIFYSLEEDADDWNTPKLIEVVQSVYAEETTHPVREVLGGRWDFTHPANGKEWVDRWLAGEGNRAGLNPSQQMALKLPFKHALSLIQGPPGTGKTNLLGWILIALVRHAQANHTPLRIAVGALTHHAIDQVLAKVVALVNTYQLSHFPVRCWKLGQWDGPEFDETGDALQVEPVDTSQPIAFPAHLILGATGYGLYHLLRKQTDSVPHKPFDWIVFDEASQLLVPQAMLSLIHGKGNYLFLGDIHQLPPVTRSPRPRRDTTLPETAGGVSEETARRSLLETLMQNYPKQNAFLETTYRMNAEICAFPSRTWYDARLAPAPEVAAARLTLTRPLSTDDILDRIIDPGKPVVLVRTYHQGCGQESKMEADILARIAHHLLCRHGLAAEQLALISPHRAQNNAITGRLSERLDNSSDLPLIDTVERIQGAERDVIIFGLTCSDPDQVLGEFLNNPNRFNVAITRARKKLIVVGSDTFISAVAQNENALTANACFKAFFEHIDRESDIAWHAA